MYRKLFKADRIKYWISKGAQFSETAFNLLLEAGIVEGKKRKSVYLSNKRRAKIAEKVKVAEEKKKAAEEKKKKEEEEVKTNAEAEVETPIENSAEEKTE